MKFTLSWMKEFVDLPDMEPNQLIETFENLGHEVEEWLTIEPEFSGVVVGKVLEVGPHPNADKVRLTKVDVGSEVLEIICGAWNFEAGAVVPVAVPGSVLGEDFEITRREIRGVTSHGMICSEVELGLGDEASGIMVLNRDYPHANEALGQPFERTLGLPDLWLEINVTPNRPDCLSVYGLARDIAAYLELPLRDTGIEVNGSGPASSVEVAISDADVNPRFSGREVRGITVGQSPHWLRWRLEQAGIRPISNVVDASNYAMVEFGHPTHAFDLDRLGSHLTTRLAHAGEEIVTLDGQNRELTPSDIVVTDGTSAVAIGGVMGGASTEVHDDTTDVFIEAAYWDPAHVLLTSKRLNLRSEASARFERGADPSFCQLGADRVAQLLEQIAGGTAAATSADVNPGNIKPWTIVYPLAETERVLGIALGAGETTALLSRLSFGVSGTDPLTVTVPTRRSDVQRKVDLVEEIARMHGFEGIPDSVPHGPGGGLPFREQRLRMIREIMAGAGYHEMLSFSFIGSDDLDRLGYPEGHDVRTGIRVVNPLNDSEGVMRTTLLPGVLKGAATNLARRASSAKLFEIGKVFLPGAGKLPDQPDHLAFAIAGVPSSDWTGEGREPDIFDGTGTWELLASRLAIRDSTVRQAALPSFHPGRCAEILLDGVVVGVVGEVHPAVAADFGLNGRVVAAEIDLAELLVDRGHWVYESPSAYPPNVFDLSFKVNESVPAHDVLAAATAGAGEYLEAVRLFDVFTGESIGEGSKSVAMSFVLRAPDRTLTDEEAAPIRQAIATSVAAAVGAELRGEI